MKNKKLKELIQKPLRFHHQDIHEELDHLKKHQVKSRWYYIFWGAMVVSVVGGQIYVGSGYRKMAESNKDSSITVTCIPEYNTPPVRSKNSTREFE
jgi:hypothetical protein